MASEDDLGPPTGIDWSRWNFLNEEILKAVEANTAETVVRQIMTDLKYQRPHILRTDAGTVEIAVQLIEGTDTWTVFDIESLWVDEDISDADADAIIASLHRLIRTVSAQKQPTPAETEREQTAVVGGTEES